MYKIRLDNKNEGQLDRFGKFIVCPPGNKGSGHRCDGCASKNQSKLYSIVENFVSESIHRPDSNLIMT